MGGDFEDEIVYLHGHTVVRLMYSFLRQSAILESSSPDLCVLGLVCITGRRFNLQLDTLLLIIPPERRFGFGEPCRQQ